MERHMRSITATLGLIAFGLVACEQELPTDTTDASASAITSVDAPTLSSQVVDRVSAGGNDACEAFGLDTGCDGNWSLTARMKADGSVSGQLQDTFAGGGNGVHAEIDCLNVNGNEAIVGGVFTSGGADGEDWTGRRMLTALVDNGTSSGDTPDQISFTFQNPNPLVFNCNNLSTGVFPLFDLTTGQVKVWDN